MDFAIPILVGVLAGTVTTAAGMGGGMILVLALAAWWDPLTALAVTAPALLVGNLHRLSLYREHIQTAVAWRYAAGAFPGAVIGGLVATSVPQHWLELAMVAMAGLAVARFAFNVEMRPPKSSYAVAGFAVGFVAATGGGGGVIAAPFLLATGLSGKPYVTTGAIGAVAVHVGRFSAYSASGIVSGDTFIWGGVLAVAITLGNLIGDQLRDRTPEPWVPRVELGVVGVCAGLALLGLA